MNTTSFLRAGLVGVTGYTGMELVRLMAGHPAMKLTHVTSRKEAGKKLYEIYPFAQGLPGGNLIITEPDATELSQECDIVFLAIPHGAAMNMGAELLAKGCKVVDLSADYRIRDVATYEAWYKVEHTQTGALKQAVYGLPELYAEKIASASLVANPGCYPTAAILALYPALLHALIDTDGIIVDAKSGTTGAGRGANIGSLYCEVADSFKAYNIGGLHRHTPEIEQELSGIAKTNITISFNPHLLPVNRGILETIYCRLNASDTNLDAIHALYTETYQNHPFVRVLPKGKLPELKHVRGTMFCDIAPVIDKRTQRLLLVSAIDNLCRGASGQALANANLMCGLALETGLQLAPLVP